MAACGDRWGPVLVRLQKHSAGNSWVSKVRRSTARLIGHLAFSLSTCCSVGLRASPAAPSERAPNLGRNPRWLVGPEALA